MSRIPTLIAGLLLWGVAPPTMSQDIPDMEREGPPTIEVKTGGMDHLEGFFDLYWDEREGKLYWEIDRWESEFLYQVSLASGIGSNPVGLDRHEIEVRRIDLDTFGEPVVRPGEPLASAEEVLVPLYLHHRYQLKAAIHSIGGADYSFALRGDGQTPVVVVPGARQREALGAALETLSPSFLAIPERVLALIPPRAYGMASGETFANRTNPTLDPLGAAAMAADFTVSLLLQPERMARLVEFHSRSQEYPGLPEVTDALFAATWYAPVLANTYHAAVQRVAQRALLDRLIEQAGFKGNTPAVRAVLSAKIAELGAWLEEHTEESAHNALALEDILRWQDRPEGITAPSEVLERPAGQPIGG